MNDDSAFISNTSIQKNKSQEGNWKAPNGLKRTGGDLIYLIEKGGRTDIGSVMITLFHVESELAKIKETEHPFIYERIVTGFNLVKSKVAEILKRNHWRILISKNDLKLLNINDKTIEAIQFANILNEDEIKGLKSFIEKHFTPFFLRTSENF